MAEVIESKRKPSQPRGEIAQTAFGAVALSPDQGTMARTIVALGHQDVDPDGLTAPPGIVVLGASSDHLVLAGGPRPLAVGTEISFTLGYGALVRAMTSPFVEKTLTGPGGGARRPPADAVAGTA